MSKFAAIVLSYNRPLNMPLVIQGLESQSFIDDIIIIHNSPESPQFPKHKNIVSDINLGCAIRHSIASLLSGYDYFVFIDDDLYLNRDLSDKIKLSVSMCGKKSVLGLFGLDLKLEDGNDPYSNGKNVVNYADGRDGMSKDHYLPVDIVKGRFHIISHYAAHVMLSSHFNTNDLVSEDDIRVNVTLQKEFGEHSYLIPYHQGDTLNLSEPQARWHRPKHFGLRNSAINQARDQGWEPADRDRKH